METLFKNIIFVNLGIRFFLRFRKPVYPYFCSEHKISPMVEHFKFAQINDAITKLRHNELRFRAVLTW